jgi:hypothetical protein
MRWSRHGDPLVRKYRPHPEPCHAPGCDRVGISKGLCDRHYRRLLDRGDISDPVFCPVCPRPDRAVIEARLMSGEPIKRVGKDIGILSVRTLRNHCAEHAGVALPEGITGKRCRVCDHPEVEEIDRLLVQRLKWDRLHPVNLPRSLTFKAIGRRFGFTGPSWFRHHITPEHQARRAQYELDRLAGLSA